MDSGWAVIVGASIALVGSVLAPWIRDATERRHLSEQATRQSIAESLRRISIAMPELARASEELRWIEGEGEHDASSPVFISIIRRLGAASTEMEQAAFELGLLLDNSDREIEILTRKTAHAIREPAYGPAMGAYSVGVSRWYRREISASSALKQYDSTMMQLGRDPLTGSGRNRTTTGYAR